MIRRSLWAWGMILGLFLAGCQCGDKKGGETMENPYAPKPYVELEHPEWTKNASIYEVNVRQFTPEGTFKAFEAHLPRLKELGVDILWLMPIHPIGEKNRKGEVGSYYSVKDYYGVNPEFGTLDDLKHLVNKIHEMGMYVIIDWVGNHSAWDNPLVAEHPDWYTKDAHGNFQPTPWYDWSDIIDFDYEKPEVREYMTKALKYWVSEADIDGFRCDVAGFMPTDFWENARRELDEIKPVFMLAEWESRDLHKNAFDMTYSWSLYREMHEVAMGKAGLGVLNEYMAHHVNTFPKNGYRMTFVDNHDKNSWEGTPFSMFGDAVEACMVLATTVEGMPLVYSGQEAGLNRKLAFFDKDLIEWKKHPYADFYKTMLHLKKKNKALWNGKWGGSMVKVNNSSADKVLSFTREKDGDQVVVVINFSKESVKTKIKSDFHAGNYTELFTEKAVSFKGEDALELKPWEYRVYVK
ncbi:MAG: alpha-amylase family glycosyl hydrolase [Cytophagales bacterium]|nr:alpha-amylase family glycosyl hydrolase [Cytophagales bacterium]